MHIATDYEVQPARISIEPTRSVADPDGNAGSLGLGMLIASAVAIPGLGFLAYAAWLAFGALS